MPRVTAVVIGHSYVRRLQEQYESGRLPHRGPPELELRFVGIGGGRVSGGGDPRKNLFNYVSEVKSYHPDIIFIQAGENDIPYVSRHQVTQGLLALARALARECQPHTIITGQLVHFPAHDPLGPVSKEINHQLESYHPKRALPTEGRTTLRFWRHKAGLYGENRAAYFSRDDVHLNMQGMKKFHNSVMAIVGKRAREVLLLWSAPRR